MAYRPRPPVGATRTGALRSDRGVPLSSPDKPEEDPDRSGEAEGERDGFRRDERPPLGDVADGARAAEAEGDADHTADQREGDGLDQELDEDVAPASPHRHPEADLSRPLRHRHEHDVHDPDAADQQ